MKSKLLAQDLNFQQIVENAFPPESLPTDLNLSLGDIISSLLPYVFVLAGLILFGYLIWGGFELLTSAGDPEKVKGAQGKITAAVVGFVIIFAAYWIAQILQIILGVSILGGWTR